MMHTKNAALLEFLVFPGLAMSLGWGLRGFIGGGPLGAMIPEGARDLIVAGRCICGDREAHSAYRVQATCMATGQAAGAAAALSARGGCEVAAVAQIPSS